MKNHKKKMIAPVVVTLVMILYYTAYFGFILSLLGGIWKYVFGIVPLLCSALTICVCIERIHEIKKGEEDDLSQY